MQRETLIVADGNTPLLSLPAEEAVLGAMLIHQPAIDEAVEILGTDGSAFGAERYRRLYAVMVAMHQRGDVIDGLTVQEELHRTGNLQAVGGIPTLAGLFDATPFAGNVAYHARIVEDYALRRRLLDRLYRAQRSALDVSQPATEAVQEVERIILSDDGATCARDEMEGVGDGIREYLEDMEAFRMGISTGWPDLDRRMNGWEPGKLYLIAARPSMGKAQPVDEPVLTPFGWRAMGSLRIGDSVIGADGIPKRVLAVHPQGVKQVYRVSLSDGGWTRCCGEHLWLTASRNERRRRGSKGSVRSLFEIKETIKRPDGGKGNHGVPFVQPVEFALMGDPAPLDPYWLGLYLGDGDSASANVRFTNPETDLRNRFVSLLPTEDAAHIVSDLCISVKRGVGSTGKRSRSITALDELGLAGLGSAEKFIPQSYLYGSPDERFALLCGLIDTDGHVQRGWGGIEFSTASRRLAAGVRFLVESLGGWCTEVVRDAGYTKDGNRKATLPSHRMNLCIPGKPPIRSHKHWNRWQERRRTLSHRIISAVTEDGESECQCITVEGGLYVTRHCIVTHNSAFAQQTAMHAAIDLGKRVDYFATESDAFAFKDRGVQIRGRVDMNTFKQMMRENPENADHHRFGAGVAQLKLAGDRMRLATSVRTAAAVRARSRRNKARYGLDMIVVDHIVDFLPSPGAERERSHIPATLRELKQVARELWVPVIALHQLSRLVESEDRKKDGHRPRMSDLREGGEEPADFIGLLYRPEYYFGPVMQKKTDSGIESVSVEGLAELIVGKQRDGWRGTVPFYFTKEHTRFDMLGRER